MIDSKMLKSFKCAILGTLFFFSDSQISLGSIDCEIPHQSLLEKIRSYIAGLEQKVSLAKCEPYLRELKIGKHPSKIQPILEDLTPLWGQEYVGADLAHDFMKSITRLTPVGIGIVDTPISSRAMSEKSLSMQTLMKGKPRPNSPFVLEKYNAQHFSTLEKEGHQRPILRSSSDRHGNLVANLIFGEAPIGVGHHAFLASHQVARDLQLNPNLFSKEKGTRLVNLSYIDGDLSEQILLSFTKQIDPDTTIVIGAGNGGIQPITIEHGTDESDHLIAVGSLAPNGLVSEFSQESPLVTLFAPSDFYLISADSIGSSATVIGGVTFSGTSGAASIVTGALSNALAIYPSLTPSQQKQLLIKTAIKVPNTKDPNQNGSGMVNAYLVARVAERIATEKLNLGKQSRSIEDLLSDPKTYDFQSESTRYLEAATSQLKHPTCDSLKKALTLLRQSFLLSSSEAARKALIQLYQELHLDLNKQFYQSLGSPEELHEVILSSLERKNLGVDRRSIGAAGLRSLSLLPDKEETDRLYDQFMKAHPKIRNFSTQPHLFYIARHPTPDRLQALSQDELETIAFYLPPSKQRTDLLNHSLVKHAATELDPEIGPFSRNLEAQHAAFRLPKKERDAFLLGNLFSKKPYLDYLALGVMAYIENKGDVHEIEKLILDRSYPDQAKEVLLLKAHSIWGEKTDEILKVILSKQPSLYAKYLFQDVEKNRALLMILLKSEGVDKENLVPYVAHWLSTTESQNLEILSPFFVDPILSARIGLGAPSSYLRDHYLKILGSEKKQRPSLEYALAALIAGETDILNGRKLVLSEIEKKWGKKGRDEFLRLIQSSYTKFLPDHSRIGLKTLSDLIQKDPTAKLTGWDTREL